MIYFTLYEYILGSVSFLILGFLFSLFSSLIYQLLYGASDILNSLIYIYKCKSIKEIKNTIIKTKSRAECDLRRKSKIGDFLVALFFSSSLIVFNYCFFDGIPRVFPIFIAVSVFVVSRKLSNKIIIKIYNGITFIPKLFFSYVLYSLLIPVKLIAKEIYTVYLIIYYPIIRFFRKIKTRYITENKVKKLRKFILD